jgi:predicted RNase H-like HicB family nuclease
MQVSVEFSAKLPVTVTKKRKWFLATCPILDVHSQGDTEKKAVENLRQALSLFFISCFERGTLDAVLKECGFEAAHSPVSPQKQPPQRRTDFIDVPIPFQVRRPSQAACRA